VGFACIVTFDRVGSRAHQNFTFTLSVGPLQQHCTRSKHGPRHTGA